MNKVAHKTCLNCTLESNVLCSVGLLTTVRDFSISVNSFRRRLKAEMFRCSGQHQQTGQCLLPLVAAKFFVDDPADASSQRHEECQCGLLLTVAMPAKQIWCK